MHVERAGMEFYRKLVELVAKERPTTVATLQAIAMLLDEMAIRLDDESPNPSNNVSGDTS